MDGEPIVSLTAADKEFLQKFTNLKKLSLNATKLKSLANFPVAALIKVSDAND